MATAASLRAGRAIIEVTLLTKQVTQGLRHLETQAKAVGAKFAKIGTFGIAGGGFAGLRNLFIGSAAATAAAWPAKVASNVELAAAQMSVFTGDTQLARDAIMELQRFSAVAFQDVENLATQMRLLMTRDISQADAIEDIKALSVVAAGSQEEFEQLTKAFADVRSATRLNGEEMRQFKNTAFNPFIEISKKTGESFADLKKRMEAGGISFDEVRFALRASVREGGLFHGMLDKIGNTLTGQIRKAFAQFKLAVLPIGDEMLKPLTAFFRAINGVMPAFTEFVRKNASVVQIVFAAAAGIAGLAIVFVTLGLGMTVLAIAAKGLAIAIGLVTAALTASVSLPMLLVGAFALLVVEFMRTTDVGQAMVASLVSLFGDLGKTVTATFTAMGQALSGGELQLAAQVLWAGLKVAFLEGTESLRQMWLDFKEMFVRTFIELSFDIQSIWVNLVANLKNVWGEFTRWFQDAWDVIVTALAKIGETEGVKAELDRALVERVGGRESEARNRQADIARARDAQLRDIEASREIAQNFGGEIDEARKASEAARKQLDELRKSAQAAAGGGTGENFFGKNLAKFMKGGLGTAKDIAAVTPEAFLDTRLARQALGGNVDQEQLDELRKIRKIAENRGPAEIPVV